MGKLIISITILFFLAGCVTPAVRPTIQDTKIIDAPFDKVWSALIATLSERALPIKAIEKESGVVTTDFVVFASGRTSYEIGKAIDEVAVKPSGLLIWSRAMYKVSIFATKAGEDATNIKITTHIQAFEVFAFENWVVLYSNGTIERGIFTDVKAKIW